jgi:pyridoxal phosphate enzyme (YggS family)
MSHAAMRGGRGPEEVRLVAVTKTVGPEVVREAIEAGLRVFGENKVQEARDKIGALASGLSTEHVEWHLIGHLQKNKAKYAVRLFDLIHTLDSIGLADELDREAAKLGRVQRVLVQVKLSEEETKHGADPAVVMALLEHAASLRHLRVEGLMTMPPYDPDPESARPCFRRLSELREALRQKGFELSELSMGMSHDFEVAIEEGATLVRVGTALFGERR